MTKIETIATKERILKIKEIFFKETDENHELSFKEVLNLLKKEYDKDCDVGIKTIKDDIKILSEYDTYLIENQDKFGKKLFSQQDRIFETNDLRTLIDSISSAGSISIGDKDGLISKIKQLTSRHIAEDLSNQIYTDFKIINEDKTFRINLNNIHMAIQNQNKIAFKYGRYDLSKEFKLNKKTYQASPYGLVWENGFYYLVAFDEDKNKIINFRVDRMRKVEEIDERYVEDREFELSTHVNNSFNMYPGRVESIEIKFHKHLINAIIDRFGRKVTITQVGEDHFILKTRAAINMGLTRWVLNWGSDAEVLKPESLVDEIRDEVEKMHEIYKK